MYEKLHKLAISVLKVGAESIKNFNVDLKENFPRVCDNILCLNETLVLVFISYKYFTLVSIPYLLLDCYRFKVCLG